MLEGTITLPRMVVATAEETGTAAGVEMETPVAAMAMMAETGTLAQMAEGGTLAEMAMGTAAAVILGAMAIPVAIAVTTQAETAEETAEATTPMADTVRPRLIVAGGAIPLG
jgi:hypothetical protein